VAVCNERGDPTLAFVPGQKSHFFYEYEVLRTLETPVGGFSFRDASGLVFHGKTTLQFASPSPTGVPKGSRLRFYLELQLNVAPGDYWFSLGLSSTNSETFHDYCFGDLTHRDLESRVCVHSRINNFGPFVVLAERRGKLLYHGLVDLPGKNIVSVVDGDENRPSSPLLEPFQVKQPPPRQMSSEFAGNFENSKIVYLASYPRSGNTWLRNLIEFYFDRKVSSLYPEWQDNFAVEGNGQNDLFVAYRNLFEPIKTRNKLMNGIREIFNNDLRGLLTNLDNHFFIKTHELPYERFIPEEAVVYIVRHPAAAIWSYYNYLRDHKTEGFESLTLDDVIWGRVPFRSWSAHVEAWLKAGETLGSRFLIVLFEALSTDENGVCQRLSQLTGLPRRGFIGTFPSFEYWHQQSPEFYRQGETEDWRSGFSAEQMELISQLHGETARKLGYEVKTAKAK
jgi:Sulfotransferase domain/Wzt C-terminal domain